MMALKIQCDGCEAELDEPGAVAFSPPIEGSFRVSKFHLCRACWPIVSNAIAMIPRRPVPPQEAGREG